MANLKNPRTRPVFLGFFVALNYPIFQITYFVFYLLVMIKIQAEKVRVPSNGSISDLAKNAYLIAANGAVDSFVAQLKKEGIEKKACDKHPNHTSTVILRAVGTKAELFKVEKRGFCCPDFEKAINITVKK